MENLSCPLPLIGLVFGMLGSQVKDAVEEGITWWEELLCVVAFGEKIESIGCKGFVWRIWSRRRALNWRHWTGDEGGGLFIYKSQTLYMGWKGAGLYWSPLPGGPAVLGKCEGTGLVGTSIVPSWKKTRKLLMWFREQPCRCTTAHLAEIPLGMMEHLLSWPLWLLPKLPARRVSGEGVVAPELHFSLGSPQPCGYHAVLNAYFFCKYLFCSFPLQVGLLNSTHGFSWTIF